MSAEKGIICRKLEFFHTRKGGGVGSKAINCPYSLEQKIGISLLYFVSCFRINVPVYMDLFMPV